MFLFHFLKLLFCSVLAILFPFGKFCSVAYLKIKFSASLPEMNFYQNFRKFEFW